MNRTEHWLRTAFDPDYEAKWKVLVEMRKRRRGDTRDCFIIYMGWTLLIFAIFRNPWAILINPIVYVLGSYVYCRHLDRVMRRRLGM
jgi:hypothetical protein